MFNSNQPKAPNTRRVFTRSLSVKLKSKLALHFSQILQNDPSKKALKQYIASKFPISFKTALRWARNPDKMKPILQKARQSRSKLSSEQIQTIKPFLGQKTNKWIKNLINQTFQIQVSLRMISKLKKKHSYLSSIDQTFHFSSKLTKEQKQEMAQKANEQGIPKTSKMFGIPLETLRSWTKKNMDPKEQFKRLQTRGRKPRLNQVAMDILKSKIERRNEDGKLVSIKILRRKIKHLTVDQWIPTSSTVIRILKKLRITSHKATSKSKEQLSRRFPQNVKKFQNEVAEYAQKNSENENFRIWAMDETGVWNHSIARRTYTFTDNPKTGLREPKSSENGRDTFAVCISNTSFKLPLFSIQHQKEIARYQLINGQRKKEVIKPRVAGMNLKYLNKWLDVFLQYASPGDLLIWDNLASHRNKMICKRLEDRFIQVMRTPPYSACEVSPLDNALFAQLKNLLMMKKTFKTFKAKKKGVKKAFAKISFQNIENYWKKCGLPILNFD